MTITEAQKRSIYKYIEKNKEKFLESAKIRERNKWNTDEEFKERKKLAMKAYQSKINENEELKQQKKEYQKEYQRTYRLKLKSQTQTQAVNEGILITV